MASLELKDVDEE
ncbi:hypothetical protein NPIL_194301, partial [Nephila pilipes]